MKPLHQPLDEFERIARNKPHPGIAKHLPKVTDGTLAALIQEQPKRIIQQVPTGKVVSTKNDWLSIVASFIFEKEIIPNSTQVADLIQKCWGLISKSLTYGSQPAFVQFINRGDYFGTDFTLPYIKDVILEPGKLTDKDSNVMFLRTWWSKNQIEALIYKEETLAKNSKARNDSEPYKSGWDIKELKRMVDKGAQQKDANAQTPSEKNNQTNSGFYEIVHAFQRGIGAEFYSFSPSSESILRRRINKDPRGQIPIHFMYSNIDFSNPLGRGSVELSGGMQNLLDSDVQAYQYMRALLMNPPIMIKGNIPSSSIRYEPAAQWRTTDPSSSISPVNLSTESLTSFPNNYGLIKSQILNLNSSTDTSVSSEVGNPGFSKTPAGVNMTEQRLGISDNYIRRQFEAVWQDIAETEINLYFAERNGTQELQLDAITAKKIREIDESMVNEDDKIVINYDSETEKLNFEVDATSSSKKDDAEQIADLKDMLDTAQKDPGLVAQLLKDGYKFKPGEAYRQIFELSGVNNIDKIIAKMTDEEIQTAQEESQNVPHEQPKISVSYSEMPPEAKAEVLNNAGLSTTPEQVTAYEQSKQPDTPAPGVGDHPIVKLMESLNIKFTDLPEDSQHQLLDQLNLHSEMTTPTAQALQLKASDSAVKVAQLQHQSNMANIQSEADVVNGKDEESMPEMDQEDMQLAQHLQQMGYDDQKIGQAIAMHKHGLPEEEIVQMLEGNQQGVMQ